jgi:eukaryotic-like serine/threonine-protein kinase
MPTLDEVEAVFHAALRARRSGAAPNLIQLCRGDDRLRAEVESLLRHFDRAQAGDGVATEFLETAKLDAAKPAGASDPLAAHEDWSASFVGGRIAGFTLGAPLGGGGMGVVFVAEQERPRRTVAVKLIRPEMAAGAMRHRFEREGQILALLNHPGIAQIYAAGVADLHASDGRSVRTPYIAMELVDGPNILDHARQSGASPAQCLSLIARVCDAVEHAHRRGVVHRDLKPANILVVRGEDGQPQPKVLDFGVARGAAESSRSAGDPTQLTLQGHLIGTLAYMSPEHVRSANDVDVRSDVYSLGVILYQMLCGRLPVDVSGSSIFEAARQIGEATPPPLSAHNRAFRGDVEVIVGRALQRDPARRYQWPAELARDVRRYLAGEPIEARRDSLVYVLGKRAAQYRTIALISAALLVVVLAAAVYARRQQQASARAAREAIAAHAAAGEARMQAERAAGRLAAELSASRVDQGRLLAAAGDVSGAERLLWDEYLEHPASRAARWALWQLYARTGCLRTFLAHPGECRALALAPDGRRFATGGDEAVVRVWSVPHATPVAALDTGLRSVRAVAFAPDGVHLAAAGEGGAVIVNARAGAPRRIGPAGDAHGTDFAANGLAVAVGGDDGFVRLFDASDGRPLAEIPRNKSSKAVGVRAVRFDPTCAHLAAAYEDGAVHLWRVELRPGSAVVTAGPSIAGRPGTTGYGVDFSHDGAVLATGSSDRTLSLWRVSDGAALATWATNNGSPRAAAFSHDGQRLAVPGFWRTQLLDARTGQPAPPPNLPNLGDGGGFAAAFTPDDALLIATGPAGTCRVWDLRADPATLLSSTDSAVRDLATARVGDECRLASVQSNGELILRSARVHERDAGPFSLAWNEILRKNVGSGAQTLAMTQDGARLVVGRSDGHVLTLSTRDGATVQDLPAHAEAVTVVRLTRDERTLVTGGADDVARVWRWRADGGGWEAGPVLRCEGDVSGAAIRPDDRVVATVSRPGQLRFWELDDGRMKNEVAAPGTPWRAVYSADGSRIAVGTWDAAVQVWSVAPSQPHASQPALNLPGHTQLVMNQAFDDAGALLASVSNDGTLRVWDMLGGVEPPSASHDQHRRCLLVLEAGGPDALCVGFLPAISHEGKFVAVGYGDGTIRVWDLGYFDRHIDGQIEHQRALRHSTTQHATAQATQPARP